MATDVALLALGLALVLVARWAARRRGTRWDSLVALRVGDVLLTEVVGAFLIGYALGSLLSPPDTQVTRPGPPRGGRFGPGTAITLPVGLGLLGAALAALAHVDLRDVFLAGRSTRNAVRTYIGWDVRVVKAIPAHGFGEVLMRDGLGNVMTVVATADVDIAEGAVVKVTGTRDLNLVVSPRGGGV